MKTFIFNFLLFFSIPIVLLICIYLVSDPFKTLKKFTLKEFSIVNREYLSTELFFKNRNQQNYNSFIFGSSRGCGINTYKWKSFLPEGSNQFLFQAWGETITGIYQKINYLEKSNIPIINSIILLDIPSSFSDIQEPKTALGIKHYMLSGHTEFYYQCLLFYAFIKPSEVLQSTKNIFIKPNCDISFDSISNDWYSANKVDYFRMPFQDSTLNKSRFKERQTLEKYSKRIINPEFERVLNKILCLLKKNKTKYKIVITPDYNQLHVNRADLLLLEKIFGVQNVYNYSGKNEITEDKYNFMDIGHFDRIVGWKILEDIYNNPYLQ